MSKVVLVAGMCEAAPILQGADYIGVDHGAVCCMRQGIRMRKAVGDFDSITKEELAQLKQFCDVEKLPSHKNETDTEVAIETALQLGYDDIILYGGLGGRLDHEMANLHLMIYRDLPLTLMNDTNILKVLRPGTYEVEKQHTYLSFLPLEDSCISEEGVAYPLKERVLKVTDIYPLSNEINGTIARITVHYGRVLMMQCRDE